MTDTAENSWGETIVSHGSPDITRLECQNVLAHNGPNLRNITVEYAYEMLFDCSDDTVDEEANGMHFIESSILLNAEELYLNLPRMSVLPH